MDNSENHSDTNSLIKNYSLMVIAFAVFATLVGFVVLVSTIGTAYQLKLDIGHGNVLLDFFYTVGFWLIVVIVFPIAALTYLFLSGISSGLLALPGAFLWREPKCIVVLRRFHRNDASKQLKQVLRKQVAPFGHVYTLADRDVKISWFIKYPLLLTQFAYMHFRPRLIKSAQDMHRLKQVMSMRWFRNINWLVSWNKVFPVSSVDLYWEQCVKSMCELSDLIICDVSEQSSHIKWEVQQILANQWLDKTIFLTSSERQLESELFLDSLGINKDKLEKISKFNNGDDHSSLKRTISSRLNKGPQKRSKVVLGAKAWTHGITQLIGPIIGFILLSLLLMPLGQDVLQRVQNSKNISMLVEELNSPSNQTSGLEQLKETLTSTTAFSEPNSIPSGFTDWVEKRAINLLILLEEDVLINESWLEKYDRNIVPLLTSIQRSQNKPNELITEIIELTPRPSVLPIWLDNLKYNVNDKNPETLSRTLKALRAYDSLNSEQISVITELLAQRLTIFLPKLEKTTENESDSDQVLYSLALLNTPRSTEVIVEACGKSQEARQCRQLPPKTLSALFHTLSKAWYSENSDRNKILIGLSNMGLPEAREIWQDVINNFAGKFTNQQIALAAEGIAEAGLNDMATPLIDLIHLLLTNNPNNPSQIDLGKRVIKSLGKLTSENILPSLYKAYQNKTDVASQFHSTIRAAIADQLLLAPIKNSKKLVDSKLPIKPLVTVGTIGQVDHGKTTLTAAITSVLSKKNGGDAKTFDFIDNAPEVRERGITISASFVEYDTPTRHYAHIDSPGHIDQVKSLITGLGHLDGAILVVAADEGPQPETYEHIHMIRAVGIKHVVVYLNKMDLVTDLDLIEQYEMEIRELLTDYGYQGDDVPIIRGSALLSLNGDQSNMGEPSILQLVQAMDSHFPIPIPYSQNPMLMTIEGTGTVTDTTQLTAGRIEAGQIHVGSQIEVVGLNPSWKTQVNEIIPLSHDGESFQAGDTVALLVDTNQQSPFERGQVIAAPASITAHTNFKAEIYMLSKDEGGRSTPFFRGYKPQFYFRTADFHGEVELPEGGEIVMPGDNLSVSIKLTRPVPMEKGLRFAIREGGRTVGAGIVVDMD